MVKLAAVALLFISVVSAHLTPEQPTVASRQPTSVTVIGAGGFTEVQSPASIGTVRIVGRTSTVKVKQFMCTGFMDNLVGGRNRTCEWK